MGVELSTGRPLTAVILGNSLSVLSVPRRSGHEDGIYAEVLRDRLAVAGVASRVQLEGRWFDFAKDARKRYEECVRAHLPDVVILQFGVNESQPWLMPIGVVRHFLTVQDPTTRLGKAYRNRVSPRVWPYLRRYRQWAAARVGTRTWQTTPHRFEASMTALIAATRGDSRPLVLVLDVEAPGATLRHFLPGAQRRHTIVQASLSHVVASFDDPEVRLVKVSEIVSPDDPDLMPDSIHYSPEGHRRVGEVLAAEVLDWLAQPSAPASLRLQEDWTASRALDPPGGAGQSTRKPR